MISRDDLIHDLADICRETGMRQTATHTPERAGLGNPLPRPQDYERAEDIVDRLVELGVYTDPSESPPTLILPRAT